MGSLVDLASLRAHTVWLRAWNLQVCASYREVIQRRACSTRPEPSGRKQSTFSNDLGDSPRVVSFTEGFVDFVKYYVKVTRVEHLT